MKKLFIYRTFLLWIFAFFIVFSFITPVAIAQSDWTKLGLDQRVYTITNDNRNPNTIYAGTENGVYKSVDGGENWLLKTNPGIPALKVISTVSNPQILYATKGFTGIQKSIDEGNTWFDITNNLGHSTIIMDLAVDPINTNIVFAAMYGQCGGIWKTSDGGENWNAVSGGCDFYRIINIPNTNILYAGTINITGYLLQSVDSGNTWFNPGNSNLNYVGAVRGLAINPNKPDTIYAGTESNGIYKSEDGGKNWEILINSPQTPIESAITVNANDGTIYIGSKLGIWESKDEGNTWISLNFNGNVDYIDRLVVFPNNLSNIYAATTNGIYKYKIQSGSNNINLDVTLLKQTNDLWGKQIYDTANKWAPKFQTIHSWGCALTSATMILNYYGYNKLLDGNILNPGTLNTWLKNQEDGYIGSGLVNWLAISRLTKKIKQINEITSFDALEFSYKNYKDTSSLNSDLTNSWPDILNVFGHFIVATGIEDKTFNINDPYYSWTTLEEGYSNNFSGLSRYIPSNTDLSYIMLVSNTDLHISVRDSIGSTYENLITSYNLNDDNTSEKNSPIQLLYISKPNDDRYTFLVKSNKNLIYSMDVYFYNKLGEVKKFTLKGILSADMEDNYSLIFNKNNLEADYITEKINKQILRDKLNLLYLMSEIDNKGILNSLNVKLSTNNFKSFINELDAQRNKHVSQMAYDIVVSELNNLY